MSFARLTLTDLPGALEVRVEYDDGDGGAALDLGKPSHEHMLLMMAALDRMSVPKGEPVHILPALGGHQAQFQAAQSESLGAVLVDESGAPLG